MSDDDRTYSEREITLKLGFDDMMIAWADGRDRTWREQVPADYRDRIDL